MFDIFISYRRSDGLDIARDLYKELGETKRGFRPFLDTSDFDHGEDFKIETEKIIKECANFLFVATPDSLTPRCGEDNVMREIELALEEKKKHPNYKIIVLQANTTPFEKFNDLPDKLKDLSNYTRIFLKDGFNNAIDLIVETITKISHKTMWLASNRWLEFSKKEGGRFHNLSIIDNLLPFENEKTNISFPIKVSKNNEDLALVNAVEKTKSSMYLIGTGGIGKTTSLVSLLNYYYDDVIYNESSIVPIFIELSKAPNDTNSICYKNNESTFIIREICSILRNESNNYDYSDEIVSETEQALNEPYIDSVRKLFNNNSCYPEYLLLLDGLNEVNNNNFDIYEKIVREIKKILSFKNVRVILTSRTDETEIDCEENNIQKIYLKGLSDELVKEYLKQNGKSISLTNDFLDVLRIPLFLLMYIKTKNVEEIESAGAILKAFFNDRSNKLYSEHKRLEKNIEEYGISSFIIDVIVPCFASFMEKNNLFYLSMNEVSLLIKNIFFSNSLINFTNSISDESFRSYLNKNYSVKKVSQTLIRYAVEEIKESNPFININDINQDEVINNITKFILNKLISSLGLLYKNKDGRRIKYSFVHQHLRDYFSALFDINVINYALTSIEYKDEDFARNILCENLSILNSKLKSRFIGEYLHLNRNINEIDLLMDALELTKNIFDDERIKNINYNLIEPIKYVRCDFTSLDLSNLDLSLINLQYIPIGYVNGKPLKIDNSLINNSFVFDLGAERSVERIYCDFNNQNIIFDYNLGEQKVVNYKTGVIDEVTNEADFTYISEGEKYVLTGKNGWVYEIKRDEITEKKSTLYGKYFECLTTIIEYIFFMRKFVDDEINKCKDSYLDIRKSLFNYLNKANDLINDLILIKNNFVHDNKKIRSNLDLIENLAKLCNYFYQTVFKILSGEKFNIKDVYRFDYLEVELEYKQFTILEDVDESKAKSMIEEFYKCYEIVYQKRFVKLIDMFREEKDDYSKRLSHKFKKLFNNYSVFNDSKDLYVFNKNGFYKKLDCEYFFVLSKIYNYRDSFFYCIARKSLENDETIFTVIIDNERYEHKVENLNDYNFLNPTFNEGIIYVTDGNKIYTFDVIEKVFNEIDLDEFYKTIGKDIGRVKTVLLTKNANIYSSTDNNYNIYLIVTDKFGNIISENTKIDSCKDIELLDDKTIAIDTGEIIIYDFVSERVLNKVGKVKNKIRCFVKNHNKLLILQNGIIKELDLLNNKVIDFKTIDQVFYIKDYDKDNYLICLKNNELYLLNKNNYSLKNLFKIVDTNYYRFAINKEKNTICLIDWTENDNEFTIKEYNISNNDLITSFNIKLETYLFSDIEYLSNDEIKIAYDGEEIHYVINLDSKELLLKDYKNITRKSLIEVLDFIIQDSVIDNEKEVVFYSEEDYFSHISYFEIKGVTDILGNDRYCRINLDDYDLFIDKDINEVIQVNLNDYKLDNAFKIIDTLPGSISSGVDFSKIHPKSNFDKSRIK